MKNPPEDHPVKEKNLKRRKEQNLPKKTNKIPEKLQLQWKIYKLYTIKFNYLQIYIFYLQIIYIYLQLSITNSIQSI